MTETMMMRSWESANMHRLFDGVLIRSAVEFRRALRLLRHYEAGQGSEYVEHMRQGLHAVEAELARRGIMAKAGRETARAPDRAAPADVPEKAPPYERSPIPPPRMRPLHRRA